MRCAKPSRRRVSAAILGRDVLRQRQGVRARSAHGRRRLHLRRGNLAAGEPGGQARPKCASGRRCRPSRACSASRPSSTTSSRSPACRSSSSGARRSTATSAWAVRAARCPSSSPATSSTAAWSRRPSASRCASCCTTSAAARPAGRPIRAVQVGGPLGAYMPGIAVRHAARLRGLHRRSARWSGHGGIVAFDDTVDMARMARYAMEFCAIESCGKCTPCRIGSTRGVEVIDRIMRGVDGAGRTLRCSRTCATPCSTGRCAAWAA